ncbi:cysteine protease [Catellatospora methionotrophica]|uniref:Cysteine protease n=1 Tax=Catellatospora methionotrophica TaxID=121620 RepID=A0A8J3LA49_9ACTN|nr:transglutaminase domain-containing protein [Catellatospora methionotrophica]GIG17157.1 cysteine protease [Catellatospora methionotrophica]
MRRHTVTGALVDGGFVAGLGMLAMLGFATTFDGSSYLLVAGIALLIGMLLAYATTALRGPAVTLAAAALLAYFAVGPLLVLPASSWTSIDTHRQLAAGAVLGWKQLLTTVPPVAADSPLLVIPFLLGLATGAAGLGAARRLDSPARPGSLAALARAGAPALVLLTTLAVVVACGTDEPAAKVLDGVVFALGTLLWTSVRLRRQRPAARTTSRRAGRAATATGLLAAAATLAALGAPLLPGAQTPRAVLRDYVVPPFRLSDYPSPLVGFRKYTKDANRLWDQELFTVTGLPPGSSVRIATLDDYDGTVWGATEEASFRLVSSRISPRPAGPVTTVQVSIAAAYAASLDVNAWLPEAGTVSRVEFAGGRAPELAASLHYNRDLSAGIVTVRLRKGDVYTLQTTVADQTLPEDLQPFASPSLTESSQAMLSSKIAAWTKGGTGLGARIRALATYLKDNGAYTDGGPGESRYLPGHSIGRLTAFLQEKAPAGDDEQYASLFALAANHLGIPARVVLGARPDVTGVVRGKDVHAWVELHQADGSWAAVPEAAFMPDPSKRPSKQPPENFENKEAAAVPPPNVQRLPTTSTDTSRVDPFPQAPREETILGRILEILLLVAPWAGPPLLLAGGLIAAIRGVKARRRRRRRLHGLPANRYAGAWQELLDRVRDLGEVNTALRAATAATAATRSEQAAALDASGLLGGVGFRELAARIDEIVYGSAEPTEQEAHAFWADTDEIMRGLMAGLGRTRRWRVALSLRSLRATDRAAARARSRRRTRTVPVAAPAGGIA